MSPYLEPRPLPHGKPLYSIGEVLTHIIFPSSGLVSLITPLAEGHAVENATVGNEGFVGIGALADPGLAPTNATVQIAGHGLAIDVRIFLREMDRSRSIRRAVLAYTLALNSQVSQNVACNAAHPLQKRMAKWLLQANDRVGGDVVGLTQEFLAQMLGVSRPSVSITARALQDTGLIQFSRKSIKILHRSRLEQGSCECYRAIREAYERHLGFTMASPDQMPV